MDFAAFQERKWKV